MRVLIIGCGYVGMALGRRLVERGDRVVGIRRHWQDRSVALEAGIEPVSADITREEELQRLRPEFDWVVNAVSSSRGGVEEYRRVHLEGMQRLVEWLQSGWVRKFIFTSSTSVYGQIGGEEVDEESPVEPISPTSRVLVEAEQQLMSLASETGFPAVILRVAGIYGPERGYLFHQYLRGEARMVGEGERFMNMIHLEDVCGSIIAALENGMPGEIYNAIDDEPTTQQAFFQWLSERLGRPMPPSVGAEDVRRKRGLTSKRISNRKLKTQLNYSFKYPTFREGFEAEIWALGL